VALTSLIAGSYHYLANQRADVLASFPIGLRLGQGFCETDHLRAVVFGDIRMYVRHICRSLCKTLLDLGLLLFQLAHPCFHGRLIHSILDGVENRFCSPLNLLKGAAARFHLRAPLVVLAVGLLGIGAHCDRYSLGRYQLIGKARQHAPLDVVTAYSSAIVAHPLAEMTKTAVAVVDDDAIFAAATSASQ